MQLTSLWLWKLESRSILSRLPSANMGTRPAFAVDPDRGAIDATLWCGRGKHQHAQIILFDVLVWLLSLDAVSDVYAWRKSQWGSCTFFDVSESLLPGAQARKTIGHPGRAPLPSCNTYGLVLWQAVLGKRLYPDEIHSTLRWERDKLGSGLQAQQAGEQ